MPNEIEEELFGQIFSDTLGTLVNKLINTRNKEWNQIIVKNVLFSKQIKKKNKSRTRKNGTLWLGNPTKLLTYWFSKDY